MDQSTDIDLEVPETAGCSGRAWSERAPILADLAEAAKDPAPWGMTQQQHERRGLVFTGGQARVDAQHCLLRARHFIGKVREAGAALPAGERARLFLPGAKLQTCLKVHGPTCDPNGRASSRVHSSRGDLALLSFGACRQRRRSLADPSRPGTAREVLSAAALAAGCRARPDPPARRCRLGCSRAW
jgi:hypothetical protein